MGNPANVPQQSSSRKCVICPKWTSHGQTKHNAVELSDSKPNSKVLNDDGLHHRFLESMVSVGCYWIYPFAAGSQWREAQVGIPKDLGGGKFNGIYGVWMGMVISQYFTWDSIIKGAVPSPENRNSTLTVAHRAY